MGAGILEALGHRWKASPSAKNTESVLKAIRPAMERLASEYARPGHVGCEREDLLSEMSIATVDSLRLWDPQKGKLLTWLFGRLQYRCRTVVRKHRRHVPHTCEVPLDLADPASDFQESAAHFADAQALLSILSTRQQLVITRTADGWTQAEIGKELGLTSQAVSLILQQARREIAAYLHSNSSGGPQLLS